MDEAHRVREFWFGRLPLSADALNRRLHFWFAGPPSELGVVAPRGTVPDEWQIAATALPRLRVIGRLIRDLGVNVSGAALALELLEAQRELKRRIRTLEHLSSDH